MKILVLSIIFFIFIVTLFAMSIVLKKRYPNPNELPCSEGIINHPTYGKYPKEVEFKQGMDLMPGQSATIPITLKEK